MWANQWVPESGPYAGLFEESDFPKALYETASSSSAIMELNISGRNVLELAKNLIAEIKTAARRNDFTHILSPERMFKM